MSENQYSEEMLPRLTIVMGVSGCGKSTLAAALAEPLSSVFVEADDFHSEDNIQCMQAGKPLTDEQRLPWIDALLEYTNIRLKRQQSVVMSFSALKRAYREPFYQLGARVFVLHIQGNQSIIAHRLQQRLGHFFPEDLLQSQFETLQPPQADEPAGVILLEHSPQRQLQEAVKLICTREKT